MVEGVFSCSGKCTKSREPKLGPLQIHGVHFFLPRTKIPILSLLHLISLLHLVKAEDASESSPVPKIKCIQKDIFGVFRSLENSCLHHSRMLGLEPPYCLQFASWQPFLSLVQSPQEAILWRESLPTLKNSKSIHRLN